MDLPCKIPDDVFYEIELEIRNAFPEITQPFDVRKVIAVSEEITFYYPQDMPEVLAYVLLGLLRLDYKVQKNRYHLDYVLSYLNINCGTYDDEKGIVTSSELNDAEEYLARSIGGSIGDFKSSGISDFALARSD